MLEGANEVERLPVAHGRTLVWRDEDSPYDNALHIYLLDRDGVVLDALEAGAAMTPGILTIVAADANGADFTFFSNDNVYRLDASATPFVRLPFRLPIGFRYKSFFRRHNLFVSLRKPTG